jgi:hypothetical protein
VHVAEIRHVVTPTHGFGAFRHNVADVYEMVPGNAFIRENVGMALRNTTHPTNAKPSLFFTALSPHGTQISSN